MATVFFYLHIFIGSVGRRILLVVSVDTLYRTSIISSSTVLSLNPFVNLSLAPLSLFLIYVSDLGVWPDCWVSTEFLRAPIPRKGSGSTTTTTRFGIDRNSAILSIAWRVILLSNFFLLQRIFFSRTTFLLGGSSVKKLTELLYLTKYLCFGLCWYRLSIKFFLA